MRSSGSSKSVASLMKDLKDCKESLRKLSISSASSTLTSHPVTASSSQRSTMKMMSNPLYSVKKSAAPASSGRMYNNALYSNTSSGLSSAKKSSSLKSTKVYDNNMYSAKRSASQRRPVGRPPMKCETIKNKTRLKTKEFIDKATEKRCLKRNSNKYNPYKCTYADGKCMTISKVYDNKLYK